MIKAIIFDTDGMVATPEPWSKQLARDFGITKEQTDPFFQHEFQQCLVGKADLMVELNKYLGGWGWKDGIDEFLRRWFESEHQLDERVVRSAQDLRKKGFACYLATNQEQYRTNYIREQMGLGAVFDAVFSSAEIGFKKPEADFFAAILPKMVVDKSEVYFWDDTPANITGAQQFGFKAKLYTSYADFQREIDALNLA